MDKLKVLLTILAGLIVMFLAFSLIIGWNIVTLFIFWIIIVPISVIFAPIAVSNKTNHFFESIAGLVIFYGLVIFLIYNHYQSDYFQFMMWSGAINLMVVSIVTYQKKVSVISK